MISSKIFPSGMAGFRPSRHYIREMKRYGVLSGSFDSAEDPIDATIEFSEKTPGRACKPGSHELVFCVVTAHHGTMK